MTPSARIPWGSKLKNFPWSSGLRPRGSRRPGFSIMTQDLTLSQNKEYRSWVKELKQRYLSARLKASVDANRTLLEYYWSLGRDIADKQYANTYGTGFYKTLSHDLRSEMPGEKGFSETNLKYMYYFYRLYSQLIEKRLCRNKGLRGSL